MAILTLWVRKKHSTFKNISLYEIKHNFLRVKDISHDTKTIKKFTFEKFESKIFKLFVDVSQ